MDVLHLTNFHADDICLHVGKNFSCANNKGERFITITLIKDVAIVECADVVNRDAVTFLCPLHTIAPELKSHESVHRNAAQEWSLPPAIPSRHHRNQVAARQPSASLCNRQVQPAPGRTARSNPFPEPGMDQFQPES